MSSNRVFLNALIVTLISFKTIQIIWQIVFSPDKKMSNTAWSSRVKMTIRPSVSPQLKYGPASKKHERCTPVTASRVDATFQPAKTNRINQFINVTSARCALKLSHVAFYDVFAPNKIEP